MSPRKTRKKHGKERLKSDVFCGVCGEILPSGGGVELPPRPYRRAYLRRLKCGEDEVNRLMAKGEFLICYRHYHPEALRPSKHGYSVSDWNRFKIVGYSK
uniref:HNH endonuclease n=1 Tax=Heterorhabditis bacteriophora TaxID=37862 RepID=A0A1I7XB17_HETBA